MLVPVAPFDHTKLAPALGVAVAVIAPVFVPKQIVSTAETNCAAIPPEVIFCDTVVLQLLLSLIVTV